MSEIERLRREIARGAGIATVKRLYDLMTAEQAASQPPSHEDRIRKLLNLRRSDDEPLTDLVVMCSRARGSCAALVRAVHEGFQSAHGGWEVPVWLMHTGTDTEGRLWARFGVRRPDPPRPWDLLEATLARALNCVIDRLRGMANDLQLVVHAVPDGGHIDEGIKLYEGS